MLFTSFPSGIQSPAELEKNINMIPGVVDNGKKNVDCSPFHAYKIVHASEKNEFDTCMSTC